MTKIERQLLTHTKPHGSKSARFFLFSLACIVFYRLTELEPRILPLNPSVGTLWLIMQKIKLTRVDF